MSKIKCLVCAEYIDIKDFVNHLDSQHTELPVIDFYRKLSYNELYNRLKTLDIIKEEK